MLKIVHLPEVNQVAITRDSVVGKLRAVQAGTFVVAIGDCPDREAPEVLRLVAPVLERHLNDQIAHLNRTLAAYGVDPLD